MPSALEVTWYRLILHPAEPSGPVPEPGALAPVLAQVGLLGPSFSYQGRAYFVPGERFLDLVVFLGCSPVIALECQRDAEGEVHMARFCHVHLPAQRVAPYLHIGDPAAAPRCPHCRVPIRDWREWLPGWQARPLEGNWRCPACGQAASAAQIDWRQAAAVVRSGIELGGIHPYEAVPADELMAALEQATGRSWRYYYARP